MKKRWGFILAALLIMSAAVLLPSCTGNSAVELEFGKTAVVGEYIEFTPVNVLVRSNEIYAPKGHEDGWVYQGDLKDQVYVALVARVKNVSEGSIKVQNLAHVTLTQGEQEYTTGECMLLTENETQLQRSAEIEAGDEATVYILADGQEKTRGDGELSLTFTGSHYKGEETYRLSCDTSKAAAVTTPAETGKTITAEDYGQIKLDKVSFKKRVNPSKATDRDSFAYYTPKGSDNLMLDAVLTVKNQQQTACDAQAFVGVTADCQGEICDGFIISETDNGKDLKEKASIKFGRSKKLHALVNVPKEWKEKDVTLYIYFDGVIYDYTLKGTSK